MPAHASAPAAPLPLHVTASTRPHQTIVRPIDWVATQLLIEIVTDGTLAELSGAAAKLLLALVGEAVEHGELSADDHLVATITPRDLRTRAGVDKASYTETLRKQLLAERLVRRSDPPSTRDPVRFELISSAARTAGSTPDSTRAPARASSASARNERPDSRLSSARRRASSAMALDEARASSAMALVSSIDARVGAGARGRPADAAASAAAAAGPQDDPAAAAERLESEGMNRRTAARLAALPSTSMRAVEASIKEAEHRPAGKRIGLIVCCLEDHSRISPKSWAHADAKLAPKREAAPSADALDNLRLQRELAAQAEEHDRVLWSLTDAERGQLVDDVLAAFPNDETLRRAAAQDPMRSRRMKQLMHAQFFAQAQNRRNELCQVNEPQRT
jgi:hypothetical protein